MNNKRFTNLDLIFVSAMLAMQAAIDAHGIYVGSISWLTLVTHWVFLGGFICIVSMYPRRKR